MALRVGLISDTHGWLDPRVMHHFAACDEVWHAGDIGDGGVLEALQAFKPLRAVWGNIDGTAVRSQTQEHLRFNADGLDVWITHIAGRPGNYATPILSKLKADPPGLLVCGHSHICLVKQDASLKMMYMNSGAAGKHGFHKVRTLLRFSIEAGKLHDLEVIELGQRVAAH